MMLWSMLLAGLLGAGAEETPNQSISITTVEAPSEPSASQPTDLVEGDPAPNDTPSPEKSAPAAIPITPRSTPARFSAARSTTEQPPAPLSRSRQQTMWWATTAFGLVVVLAVILTGSKVLRRMVPGLGAAYGEGPVHLLHRTHLGPKQSVCLLRCGNRLLLVGVTQEHMRTLSEITDPEEIDFIKGQCMQLRPTSTTKAFRDAFQESERKIRHDESASPTPANGSNLRPTPEELTRQLGQLRERILSFKGKTPS
jgi:flagellar biogenesis protein FliO